MPRYAPWVGGTERHVEELARGLVRRGLELEVITTDPTGQLAELEEIDGVLVRRFPCVANDGIYCISPQLGWWLLRNAHRYSLLHAHSYHTPVALQAALASRAARIPLVLSPYYHGTGHTPLRRLMHVPYRPFGRWLIRQANALTCLSGAERDLLRHHFSVRVAPTIVPGHVDIAELRSTPVPDWLPDRRAILAVNRLDAYKQTDRLIHALPYLPENFVLAIIGDGPQRRRLLDLATRTGVGSRVRLYDPLSRHGLLRWYARADVFVSLSRHETFGLALLEAAVAGAPVLASDIPAHRETAGYVGTGRVQLVSSDAPPAQLAAAIRAQTELGRAAGVDGWAVPTLDATVDGTLAAYASVVRPERRQRALRMLLVTPSYRPFRGGLETHVHEVATRLHRKGVEVTILTTDYTGELPEREETEAGTVLRVRSWPRTTDYYIAPGIYKAIRHGGWDLMHCHSYHTLVPPLAMLAALRSGLPYVITFHSGGHSSSLRVALRRLQWECLRPLLGRAERLIAVSQFEAEFFPKQLRLPTERFVTIPNGADLQYTRTATEGRRDEAPLLLSVGRLERYKGHHRAIAALPYVLRSYPRAHLRIAGEGPFRRQLERLARDLRVQERVHIGAVAAEDRQSMADLLTQASLVMLLSDYEGYPVAALEALALQRQLLVTHGSGMSELVERGAVRAIPLRSSEHVIASAIVEQLQQPLQRKPVDLPTWDDCAASLLELYQHVASERACAS